MSERKKDLIKLSLYVLFILVLILIVRLSSKNEKNNPTNTIIQKSEVFKFIDNIDDAYISSVHIVLSGDAILLDYEKQGDTVIGKRNYHNEITNYIKKNDVYYEYVNDEIERLDNFDEFVYDKTFTDLDNIKRLFDIDTANAKAPYSYQLSDVLNIYNDINKTNYFALNKNYVVLDYNLTNDTLSFALDLTSLYNLVYEKQEARVTYEVKFTKTDKVDTSWIDEKLI